LAVDGSGNLFVSDTGNLRLLKLSPSGTLVSAFGTGGIVSLGAGVTSIGVAVYSPGSVLAVALNQQGTNNTPGNFDHVYLYDSGVGTNLGTIDGFYLPTGVAFDSGGDLFVVDTGHASTEEFSAPSPFLAPGVEINPNGLWTYPGSDPRGVAVDSTGEIYVVDAVKNTVYNFAP
jgi:sugar lactone lactonase YvrE